MADNFDKPDLDKDGLRTIGLKWLFQQGTTNIILIVNLVVFYYCARWALTEGIPAHLNQIQSGYKQLGEEYQQTRAAEIAADKERYENHRSYDAERYEWIREGFLRLRGAGIGSEPKPTVVDK